MPLSRDCSLPGPLGSVGRDQDGGATKGVVSPVGDIIEYVFHGAIYWNDRKNTLNRVERKKGKENPRKCLRRVSGLNV